MKHAQETLAADLASLETSKIALQKGQGAWVKKFAQYFIAEQQTIAEILQPAGGAAPNISDKQAGMVKELQSAEAAAFDKAYVQGQIQGHQELLKIQETYISAGKDKDHVSLAKLARGQIKEHIDLLQTIQKEIRT